MSKQGNKSHGQRNEWKHRIKLFFTYFIILLLITAMLQMITLGLFSYIRLFGISVLGALVFTILHDRMGERTQIDDIADFK